MKKFNHEYIDFKPLHGGEQYIYKFENGYGASVIRHNGFSFFRAISSETGEAGSFGASQGLWELAVTKWRGTINKYGESWDLVYDTSVADDVLKNLSDKDVEKALENIKDLGWRKL